MILKFIIENLTSLFGITFLILSIIAIVLRIQLWLNIGKLTRDIKKADERVMQKVSEIFGSQKRYKNALFANKAAILEIYYSEQKLAWISYDSLTYLTRNLPNLLVSLGLLGTFVGITLNLGNITDVIGSKGGEVGVVVENLKAPLESMAIAFYSSLYAITFASLLTIVNSIFNVELRKEGLLNLLESRLDNEVTPERDLDLRFKNAIAAVLYGPEQQTKNLDDLIYRVLQTVLYNNSEVDSALSLESVLSRVMMQYFPDFRESINSFVTSINTFNNKIEIIANSSTEFVESASLFQKASKQIEGYSQALYDWRNKFADTQTKFLETTQHFSEKVDELLKQNQEASQLAKQVYETFGQSTKDFELSTRRYQEVSEKIEKSQFPIKLAEASHNLDQFSNAAKTLQTNIKGMENMAQTMQLALDTLHQLAQSVQTTNQQAQEIIQLNQKRLSQEENQLTQVKQSINASAQTLELVAEEIEGHSQAIQGVNTSLITISSTLNQLGKQSQGQLDVVSNLTHEVTILHQQTSYLIDAHQTHKAEELKQLSDLSQAHKVLTNQVIQYQNNLNLDELSLTIITGINQKIQTNLQSLAKVILALSNKNQKYMKEMTTLLVSIQNQQKESKTAEVINSSSQAITETIGGEITKNTRALAKLSINNAAQNRQLIQDINNSIKQNYLQLKMLSQTLTELLVIAKKFEQ